MRNSIGLGQGFPNFFKTAPSKEVKKAVASSNKNSQKTTIKKA